MMNSMTGFGRAAGAEAGIGFRIEISSINRKQFELKLALPHEISFYESQIRQVVSEKISRGSLTVRVDFQEGMMPESKCTLDMNAAKRVLESAEELAKSCGIRQDVTVSDLLTVPGVIRVEAADYAQENVEKLLCRVMAEAVDQLVLSRAAEGARLEKDIAMRIGILRDTLSKILPFTAQLPKQQYEKLLARLKELDLAAAPDDDRLLRELVLYADKLDVTEEITRLNSHFAHFDELMDGKVHGAVGRQLDFMVQETFREINTLGNKAACAEVSPLIVIMKTELEKIREQVQNIE